ncbi:MAG: FHA domain-containing protein [Actinomycetota bacterium]
MPALVLTILKYLFLLLIFLFLARAVRAMVAEVGPHGPRRQLRAPTAGEPRPFRPPDRVAVMPTDGSNPRVYALDGELIIGRSSKCQVVIGDTYASQVHARIFKRDGVFFIEDMGSTNGTYLNRRKVSSPTPVNRGDRARIGKTELDFRR